MQKIIKIIILFVFLFVIGIFYISLTRDTNYNTSSLVNKDTPEFKINNSQENLHQSLYPEIRIYENPSTITYEASIRSGLLKDYYITMSNIDRSDYYNIKFQKKPLMAWIWISVIMIVVGGSLRLFSNAKNN